MGKCVGEVSEPFASSSKPSTVSSSSKSATTSSNSLNPATHALAVILRGIAVPWKQTVAYWLTGNSTSGKLLWQVNIIHCGVNVNAA